MADHRIEKQQDSQHHVGSHPERLRRDQQGLAPLVHHHAVGMLGRNPERAFERAHELRGLALQRRGFQAANCIARLRRRAGQRLVGRTVQIAQNEPPFRGRRRQEQITQTQVAVETRQPRRGGGRALG